MKPICKSRNSTQGGREEKIKNPPKPQVYFKREDWGHLLSNAQEWLYLVPPPFCPHGLAQPVLCSMKEQEPSREVDFPASGQLPGKQ